MGAYRGGWGQKPRQCLALHEGLEGLIVADEGVGVVLEDEHLVVCIRGFVLFRSVREWKH